MKIILSRKGFDSSNGGVASPILGYEDGSSRLLSLPIPRDSDRATCEYADIQWEGGNLYNLITSLRHGHKLRRSDQFHPHLDPDLFREALTYRHPEWRPIFGQSGGQETQLRKEGVHNPIDFSNRPLFLFFGWFHDAKQTARGYRYVKSPDIHAFFGWLQVEQKIELTSTSQRLEVARELPWAAQHPHVACDYYDSIPNAIYIAPKAGTAGDRLILAGRDTGLPAAGIFKRFASDVHTLTRQGKTRSYWILPSWFYRNGEPKLGMHKNLKRWSTTPDCRVVQLQSVCRGQEFVFESKEHDEGEVFNWIERLVRAG
jgi:hypothetical protein